MSDSPTYDVNTGTHDQRPMPGVTGWSPGRAYIRGHIHGHQDGTAAERIRIITWLDDYGIPDPVTDSKAIPCEHDVYSWHLCEECAIDGIKAFLGGP